MKKKHKRALQDSICRCMGRGVNRMAGRKDCKSDVDKSLKTDVRGNNGKLMLKEKKMESFMI